MEWYSAEGLAYSASVPIPVRLPDDDVSTRGLELLVSSVAAPLANHSIRSYIFAKLFADSEDLVPEDDYDEGALYFACLFHDLGTGKDAPGEARFEVEGADLAAEFLLAAGWSADRIDGVWEAIALHTSSGIAERRSILSKLTREGVNMDFGSRPELVPPEVEGPIHSAYPRMQATTALVDAVVAKASRSRAAAPPYSFPGELLRERLSEPHVSRLEVEARSSRWPEGEPVRIGAGAGTGGTTAGPSRQAH